MTRDSDAQSNYATVPSLIRLSRDTALPRSVRCFSECGLRFDSNSSHVRRLDALGGAWHAESSWTQTEWNALEFTNIRAQSDIRLSSERLACRRFARRTTFPYSA
jgi:hypothetical protein